MSKWFMDSFITTDNPARTLMVKESISGVLSVLNMVEAIAVRMRLLGCTYNQIAIALPRRDGSGNVGVTTERARHILAKAYRRMRNSKEVIELKEFVHGSGGEIR